MIKKVAAFFMRQPFLLLKFSNEIFFVKKLFSTEYQINISSVFLKTLHEFLMQP
jgi:hypothetical protein